MYLKKVFLFVLLLLPLPALADKLGFWIGGGVWDQTISGTVRSSLDPNDTIDVEKDLQLQDIQDGYLYAIIEHPIPILPNFKLATTKQEFEGSGTLNVTFNGISFSESVDSIVNLDHTDLTLYWQVLDKKAIELDLGLTGRKYDGFARIQSRADPNKRSEENLDEIVPMLYGRLAFGLPVEGLLIGVDGNYVSYGDGLLSDVSARIAYQTDYVVGIEVGYRSQKLELDNVDEVFSNLTIDGPFVAIFAHF